MRIVLREWLETADAFELGGVVGEIAATAAGVEIRIEDPVKRARLAAMLQEPLMLRYGDASGRSTVTKARPVTPEDPAWVTALLDRLDAPDLRLDGEVVEE